MARSESEPKSEPEPKKACCLISEMLEESGLDRQKVRALRRQVLQGMILLCQWQLERMDERPSPRNGGSGAGSKKGPRKVPVS